MATLRRHDLLQVDPASWDDLLARDPDLDRLPDDARQLVADWSRDRRPVIARRRMPGDEADGIAVGLPLPPGVGRRRLALTLPPGSAGTKHPALLLHDAVATAPATWHPGIASLTSLGEELDTAPRVFGALLWQHLTGLPYLRPQSDLDLLWAVRDRRTAETLMGRLHRIEAAAPFRLDGELELPDGAAVNWRELSQAVDDPAGAVLVKTIDHVETRPIGRLFDPDPI